MQKPVTLIPIPPPPIPAQRNARFAQENEQRNRYHLPEQLSSPTPVGYRTRLPFSTDEATQIAALLSLEPPTRFIPGNPLTEGELFEETSLGILTARQSTNYQGHRQVTLGPQEAEQLAPLLEKLAHRETPVLSHPTHLHIGLSRPYRTPFTFLLTFIGHQPFSSLLTVPKRAWNKKYHHTDDIPTIGYLQHLHIGIWADAIERAALIASHGKRRANVWMAPFCGEVRQKENAEAVNKLEALAGLSDADRAAGWRIALVTQVGEVPDPSPLSPELCRKVGANLMAFRSERIQPGVNAEEKAPPAYQERQEMDVPDLLTEMAGRAGYNAFSRWLRIDRDAAKRLLILDRVDVLTPNGKERLRGIRKELEEITDQVVRNLPLWADLPTGKALSGNAARGKKAFALAGQRIYIGGLCRPEVEALGLDFHHAVRAFGAAASRSALVCELAGCIHLRPDCDLLAGICLMAGPVNQNDIGKQFYGTQDLLAQAHPGRNPTSLLVWTLKAKTVADPIGNEEQLMNSARKGALVDLRPGPHEVAWVRVGGENVRLRARQGRVNGERAFGDLGNFVQDAEGREIPGNRGSAWPVAWRGEALW